MGRIRTKLRIRPTPFSPCAKRDRRVFLRRSHGFILLSDRNKTIFAAGFVTCFVLALDNTQSILCGRRLAWHKSISQIFVYFLSDNSIIGGRLIAAPTARRSMAVSPSPSGGRWRPASPASRASDEGEGGTSARDRGSPSPVAGDSRAGNVIRCPHVGILPRWGRISLDPCACVFRGGMRASRPTRPLPPTAETAGLPLLGSPRVGASWRDSA